MVAVGKTRDTTLEEKNEGEITVLTLSSEPNKEPKRFAIAIMAASPLATSKIYY